ATGVTPGAARGLDVLDLLGLQPGAGARRPREGAGDPGRDLEVGVEVRRGGVGLLRLGDAEVEGLVDEGPAVHVVPVHEGDRGAGRAGPAGAPDPVQVGLLVLGALVVDHVGDRLDV